MKTFDFQLTKPATCMAFHPIEKKVFVGDAQGGVTLIDLEKNQETILFSGSHPIQTLHAVSDSLLSFHVGGLICRWGLESGVFEHQVFLPRIEGHINAMFSTREAQPLTWCKGVFSHDGSSLMVECYDDNNGPDSQLFCIDVATGDTAFEYDIGDHDYFVLRDLALSKDGQHLAASGMGYGFGVDGDPICHVQCVRMWNVETGERVDQCTYDDYDPRDLNIPLDFLSDKGQLMVSLDRELAILNADRRIALQENVDALACIPHQDGVAVGTREGKLILGTLLEEYVVEGEILDEPMKTLDIFFEDQVSKNAISSLTFSPDGRYLGVLDSTHHLQFFHQG